MRDSLCHLLLLLTMTMGMTAHADDVIQPRIRLQNVVRSYSDQQQFGNPAGIYYDSRKGEIYLADSENHQIGIFDLRGNSLWVFKHWVTDSRTGERTLGDPRSVAVTPNGEIIVSDNKADYLDVFDYRGDFLQTIDPADFDDVGPLRAASLALDKEGNLYVATKVERSEIIKLDERYRLVMRFGERGEGPDKFQDISGVWVDTNGNILVTDALSDPVLKKFNPEGKYIGGFGGRTIEETDFSLPAGLALTSGGRIWIVDTIRQVVKCITEDGRFVTMIGGFGFGPGALRYPSAISSDGDSLLVVTEKTGNRFQQFIIK